MTPTVTVIVPTRNRPLALQEALASIATQELSSVEAVVVNDGGEDVAHVVRSLAGVLPVRLINLPHNQGLATARNVGIEVARGRFLAFLDDDDVYLASHLRCAVEALESSRSDFTYTNCLVSDRRVDPTAAVAIQAPGIFDFPFDHAALAVMNYIPVNAVVCRSLRRIPARFDTSLPVLEDLDMWLRLTRKQAFRVVHVPEPTVVYHRIPSEESMTNAAVTGAAQLRRFGESQRRLYHRWPVPAGSSAARSRRHVLWMHELGRRRLAAGLRLSHFYYERALRVILGGLADGTDGRTLRARLAAAIVEDAA